MAFVEWKLRQTISCDYALDDLAMCERKLRQTISCDYALDDLAICEWKLRQTISCDYALDDLAICEWKLRQMISHVNTNLNKVAAFSGESEVTFSGSKSFSSFFENSLLR